MHVSQYFMNKEICVKKRKNNTSSLFDKVKGLFMGAEFSELI